MSAVIYYIVPGSSFSVGNPNLTMALASHPSQNGTITWGPRLNQRLSTSTPSRSTNPGNQTSVLARSIYACINHIGLPEEFY